MKKSLPLVKPEGKTTAGNYFVSNYPPFNVWSPDHVLSLHEAIAQPPHPDTPLGLYIHIPFCRKRCHFCYFKVYTDVNAKQVWSYVESVVAELKQYAGSPFIGDRKLTFIYFGGGTPSYLSPEQLGTILDAVQEVFPWSEIEEIAFEGEPGTLIPQRLAHLRETGITRLSLGVENFDDGILELNGRAHRSKDVFRVYGYAREIGFPQINIDLIAGMLNETEANWQQCVEQTIALDPDSVTIYQMEIPFNTTIYKRMKDEGKLAAPVADWETKRRWAGEAFARLEEAGYAMSSGYTAVKKDRDIKFVYRDALWRGADMLSLGVASFGHISGVHYQNEKDIEPYQERVAAGERPVSRAYPTSAEERLIREFVLQLKLGRVETGYFADKFGVNILERFAEPLAGLQSRGLASLSDTAIALSRDALLQVDGLLPPFFLPQHRE